jgi:hypothetical protein
MSYLDGVTTIVFVHKKAVVHVLSPMVDVTHLRLI